MQQSYLLKVMASFMVLGKTVLKIPVLASIFIVIKAFTLGLVSNGVFYVAIFCVAVLSLEFLLVVIYSLKFFNLEVPNEDIAWSHN